jgi:DNA-binding phage protein
MAKKITTYQEDLIEALKDPREAAAYLNAAMEEDDRALFLLALRNVAEAYGRKVGETSGSPQTGR